MRAGCVFEVVWQSQPTNLRCLQPLHVTGFTATVLSMLEQPLFDVNVLTRGRRAVLIIATNKKEVCLSISQPASQRSSYVTTQAKTRHLQILMKSLQCCTHVSYRHHLITIQIDEKGSCTRKTVHARLVGGVFRYRSMPVVHVRHLHGAAYDATSRNIRGQPRHPVGSISRQLVCGKLLATLAARTQHHIACFNRQVHEPLQLTLQILVVCKGDDDQPPIVPQRPPKRDVQHHGCHQLIIPFQASHTKNDAQVSGIVLLDTYHIRRKHSHPEHVLDDAFEVCILFHDGCGL